MRMTTSMSGRLTTDCKWLEISSTGLRKPGGMCGTNSCTVISTLPEGSWLRIMLIGTPTSVAAAPVRSSSETSLDSTSGGMQRRIIPAGRLILPAGMAAASERVLSVRAPGGVGKTMRCVERVDCPAPGLVGLRPVEPVRGMDMGWVVATPPAAMLAGMSPLGCGGLIVGAAAFAGGFWTFGGAGGVLPTGAATSGDFSFFLPNENEKGIGKEG